MGLITDVLVAILTIFTLIIVSSFVSRWKMRLKYRKLPPGPFCWPVLGYIPFLDKDNLKLTELARKYSGVYSLWVGSRFVVLIDDFEALKIVYNGEEFLGRPEEMLSLSRDDNQKTLGNMSGSVWKAHKKFWLNTFRCLSTGDTDYKSVTLAHSCSEINKLETRKDLNVNRAFELATHNIAFYLSFGKIFDENHDIIRQIGTYDDSLKSFVEMNILHTLFPWTKLLTRFTSKFKRIIREIEAMELLINDEVAQHRETLDVNNPRDFTDLFLIQMQKTNDDIYTKLNLTGSLKLLLFAASETTRNTLVWFILLMGEHQEVQNKIHDEMDSLLGRSRSPELSDKNHLPFLEAAMMETMRYKNLNHFNLSRRVLKDTNVCGYDIPKYTIIFHLMTSQFHNPKYWKEPDRFYPERFLSQDRKSVQIPEHFIPFSCGKRVCIGEKIARDTLFMYTSNLLHKFRILPPEGGVNLNVTVNFTNASKHPFVRLENRD